jgi:hypothetical protein
MFFAIAVIELTSGERNQNLSKLTLAVENGKLNFRNGNYKTIILKSTALNLDLYRGH